MAMRHRPAMIPTNFSSARMSFRNFSHHLSTDDCKTCISRFSKIHLRSGQDANDEQEEPADEDHAINGTNRPCMSCKLKTEWQGCRPKHLEMPTDDASTVF